MTKPLINITRRQALTFACFLVLYEFLTYIANDMIMPGMLTVVQAFHAPESAVATSLSLYLLGGASLQLLLGPISDRYGRRPVMLCGALIFFITTIFIACSHSIEQFLTMRFFQGMGLCFIGVIGYATLQEIFAEMDAVRLIAVMANVSISAPLLGPLFGVGFMAFFDWRVLFFSIGFFALLALWGLWRYMPEPVGQTKADGNFIPQVPLSLYNIASNYKKLVFNSSFFFGSIALGLLVLPCMFWIGLSPIILIKQAELPLYYYGLWQIPVFGASIIGNWCLVKLSHYHSIKNILLSSSLLAVSGLVTCLVLLFIKGNNFIWLMPGLIIYFFAFGLGAGPLNRYVLFSTQVSKGTASALMSLLSMGLQTIGLEIGNYWYHAYSHNNLIIGLYFAAIGLIYLCLIGISFLGAKWSQSLPVSSRRNNS